MTELRNWTSRSPYWNRYWTRRGALGLSAGAAAAAMVGCGENDDDGGETPAGGASPAGAQATATPKNGGILRQVGVGDPSTFDLHQNISVVVSGPAAPMFNGLLQMDPH